MDIWRDIKVGSKVSFLLFKDSIESMKLLDAGWDENYEENLKNAKDIVKAGFKTDARTVLGIVDEIIDGIIAVDVGNEKYHVAAVSDDIIYTKGDNLRMNCITTEDEDKWNPSIGTFGSIVSIKSYKPNGKKQEVGRVTAKFDTYAVFDESVVLNFKCVKNPRKVQLWEKFFYEAIETSIIYDGRNYNWRVTELKKKIDSKEDQKIEGLMKLEMNDEHIQLRQNKQDCVKYITIFNRSDQRLTLKGCEITSTSGFIRLQAPNKSFDFYPNSGAFKVFLTINPSQYGSFVEELTADFGVFKKQCLITLQVLKSSGAFRQGRKSSSRRGDFNGEIIPGQKISKTTRFIEIRIPDYQVCEKFRKSFDFKKQTMLVIQDFGQMDYHFLTEPLREQNYLAKMRHCIYLEELAKEIFFKRYEIDRAHFDNHNEFLRLNIEGVNEKRPSIGVSCVI